jgi:hypothetical protein
MATETEGTFKIGDQNLYTKTWLVSVTSGDALP